MSKKFIIGFMSLVKNISAISCSVNCIYISNLITSKIGEAAVAHGHGEHGSSLPHGRTPSILPIQLIFLSLQLICLRSFFLCPFCRADLYKTKDACVLQIFFFFFSLSSQRVSGCRVTSRLYNMDRLKSYLALLLTRDRPTDEKLAFFFFRRDRLMG